MNTARTQVLRWRIKSLTWEVFGFIPLWLCQMWAAELAEKHFSNVLDLWFERKVRKGNRGQSRWYRFADGFVCCFDYRHAANAFEQAVKERLAKFGLELAPDKTRGAVARFTEWIREHRHEKIGELMETVADKHRGHWNYYGS